jgi:hypothetical protein
MVFLPIYSKAPRPSETTPVKPLTPNPEKNEPSSSSPVKMGCESKNLKEKFILPDYRF